MVNAFSQEAGLTSDELTEIDGQVNCYYGGRNTVILRTLLISRLAGYRVSPRQATIARISRIENFDTLVSSCAVLSILFTVCRQTWRAFLKLYFLQMLVDMSSMVLENMLYVGHFYELVSSGHHEKPKLKNIILVSSHIQLSCFSMQAA